MQFATKILLVFTLLVLASTNTHPTPKLTTKYQNQIAYPSPILKVNQTNAAK